MMSEMTAVPAATEPLRVRIKNMANADAFKEVITTLMQTSQNAVLYTQFLTFISRFRKYSFYNRLMLFAQYPTGSQFAKASEWREHNRIIAKGERACRIFKPKIQRIPKLNKAGVQLCDAAGKPIYDEIPRGWILVPVFAYEQTVPRNDAKDVIIPAYKSVETDDPYFIRDTLIKCFAKYETTVKLRNLEFAQPSVVDDATLYVNQLYDVGAQNLTLVRELCKRTMKETSKTEWQTKALDIAELIMGMSIGTPRTQLKVTDLLQLHGEIIQLAVGSVDRAMGLFEATLKV